MQQEWIASPAGSAKYAFTTFEKRARLLLQRAVEVPKNV